MINEAYFMKYRNTLILIGMSLLFGLSSTTFAATDEESAHKAEKAKLKEQAQLEAEYEKAMTAAERERHAAEASMKKAQEQMRKQAKQRETSARTSEKQAGQARAAQEAELEKMHKELEQARRQLRESSREVARVNREVTRARAHESRSSYTFHTSSRPVIGVILGDADDVGIEVIGVSPDGPSERAGVKQGDVIVAMAGRVLATVDETGNARDGLNTVMKDIKAEEPVIVSVERGDQTLDLTVTPEIREPLTWRTVTRLPSVPHAPVSPSAPSPITDRVVIIEGIEVPEIDTEAISEHIDQIRVEIEDRREFMESGEFAPHADHNYEFEFHEFSEMGDFALHDANVWFGLPMTQGLQLAEIDPGLGEYFKTDRGVLVLKAKADNDLQLESGDVILQVGGTEVNSPAEFMRALRDFQSGDEFEIDIKRKRKDRTLKTVMPESRTSFFAPEASSTHTIKITSSN
jgi:C-terminal processing protease CtpA/Prc